MTEEELNDYDKILDGYRHLKSTLAVKLYGDGRHYYASDIVELALTKKDLLSKLFGTEIFYDSENYLKTNINFIRGDDGVLKGFSVEVDKNNYPLSHNFEYRNEDEVIKIIENIILNELQSSVESHVRNLFSCNFKGCDEKKQPSKTFCQKHAIYEIVGEV